MLPELDRGEHERRRNERTSRATTQESPSRAGCNAPGKTLVAVSAAALDRASFAVRPNRVDGDRTPTQRQPTTRGNLGLMRPQGADPDRDPQPRSTSATTPSIDGRPTPYSGNDSTNTAKPPGFTGVLSGRAEYARDSTHAGPLPRPGAVLTGGRACRRVTPEQTGADVDYGRVAPHETPITMNSVSAWQQRLYLQFSRI